MPPKMPSLNPAIQKPAPRELEVLAHFACGKTRPQISELMSISEETVKSYLERACFKLKATNKTHATTVALYLGFLVPYCVTKANENTATKPEKAMLAPHTGAARTKKSSVTNPKRQPTVGDVEIAHQVMSSKSTNT